MTLGGSALTSRLRPAVTLSAAAIPATMAAIVALDQAASLDPIDASPLPPLALVALVLLAGFASKLRIDDGVLVVRTFALQRHVRLDDLAEVGGRPRTQVPDRFPGPTLGQTLLLRDRDGRRAALTVGLWRDEAEILARVAEAVIENPVPLAEPAVEALDVRIAPTIAPDLRLSPWVASPIVLLLLCFALLFV